MFVKIPVLGGQCSLPDIFGKRRKRDRSAAFYDKNFIEQFAIAVQDFGGGGGGVGGKAQRVGQAPEEINTNKYQYYQHY